jgi:hypothetical protein
MPSPDSTFFGPPGPLEGLFLPPTRKQPGTDFAFQKLSLQQGNEELSRPALFHPMLLRRPPDFRAGGRCSVWASERRQRVPSRVIFLTHRSRSGRD